MNVREIMTRDPVSLAATATCGEAATLMKQEDCGSIPIVDGARIVGIVTDRDIVLRAVAAGKDVRSCRVSDVMTADPFTIGPDASLEDAARVMAERQVRRLPVVDDGKLVGLVAIGQLARREDRKQTGETLKEISEPQSLRGSHARG